MVRSDEVVEESEEIRNEEKKPNKDVIPADMVDVHITGEG